MKAVFVTGTDTGVGKTIVTGLLARYFLNKGYRVITQKWIQSGRVGRSRDIDIHLRLMRKTKEDINDYLPDTVLYDFKFGASPHLAARLERKRINAKRIKESFRLLSKKFDIVIVEGIGGALVPFDKKNLVIDIAKELHLPVLIVAQNKLGAINHTLLTVEAIRARGMKILGIIFNSQRKKNNRIILEDNPRIIKALTGERILGNLPWLKNKDALYKRIASIVNKIFSQLAKVV